MGGTPPHAPRPFGQFFDLIAQVEKVVSVGIILHIMMNDTSRSQEVCPTF